MTNVRAIEKCIERNRKKNIGRIPKNLNELLSCFEKENWKRLIMMDAADSFILECVIKNNTTKAIIFIDKRLTELLTKDINEKLTIFIDGTFATVPQLNNNNCQLWTIVISNANRVSKTMSSLVY